MDENSIMKKKRTIKVIEKDNQEVQKIFKNNDLDNSPVTSSDRKNLVATNTCTIQNASPPQVSPPQNTNDIETVSLDLQKL